MAFGTLSFVFSLYSNSQLCPKSRDLLAHASSYSNHVGGPLRIRSTLPESWHADAAEAYWRWRLRAKVVWCEYAGTTVTWTTKCYTECISLAVSFKTYECCNLCNSMYSIAYTTNRLLTKVVYTNWCTFCYWWFCFSEGRSYTWLKTNDTHLRKRNVCYLP